MVRIPMLFFSLVYFDQIYGPLLYLTAPDNSYNEDLHFLTSLLDLEKDHQFYHQEGSYYTINVPFEVENHEARGKLENFMISLVSFRNPLNPDLYQEFLNEFVIQFTQIKEVCKGIKSRKYDEVCDSRTKSKIENLFFYFYNSLPMETLMMERKLRLFMIGLRNAGKASIIKGLYNFVQRKPEDKSKLTLKHLLTKNFSVVSYHLPIEKRMEKIWEFYVKNSDGFVFIVDSSDPIMFSTAKEQLHLLNDSVQNEDIPFQILINKIDKKKAEVEDIVDMLELDKLKFKNINYIGVSTRTYVGLVDGLKWMADKIIEYIFY